MLARPDGELIGNGIWNDDLTVKPMKEFGVVEQDQIVEWTRLGDDDHRSGKMPSSPLP